MRRRRSRPLTTRPIRASPSRAEALPRSPATWWPATCQVPTPARRARRSGQSVCLLQLLSRTHPFRSPTWAAASAVRTCCRVRGQCCRNRSFRVTLTARKFQWHLRKLNRSQPRRRGQDANPLLAVKPSSIPAHSPSRKSGSQATSPALARRMASPVVGTCGRCHNNVNVGNDAFDDPKHLGIAHNTRQDSRAIAHSAALRCRSQRTSPFSRSCVRSDPFRISATRSPTRASPTTNI